MVNKSSSDFAHVRVVRCDITLQYMASGASEI